MSLANAVSVGLLECRSGRIVWANEALARLLDTTPEALCGRSPDAFLRDAGAGLPDWLGGETMPGPAGVVGCTLEGPDGSRRSVEVRALGTGGFEVVDVSERCRLEAETHRLGAELLAAHRELETLRARLEEESKEREDLLSVVSHELKTPLTVLTGFMRLLLAEEAGPLEPEQRRFLTECSRSAESLRRFSTHLLEANRAAFDACPKELAEAELEPCATSVVALLQPIAAERGQRLELALSPAAGRARFDPVEIEQVLTNLVGNALRHGRAGGVVLVSTRRLEAAGRAFVEVAVSDDGPGVPEDERTRIFEPYVRARGGAAGAAGRPGGAPARRPGEPPGLGLGLAICRRIVEAHGGTIGVGDAEQGGARFAFTLPARAQAGPR
jgi:signal transduction histidine kinase